MFGEAWNLLQICRPPPLKKGEEKEEGEKEGENSKLGMSIPEDGIEVHFPISPTKYKKKSPRCYV